MSAESLPAGHEAWRRRAVAIAGHRGDEPLARAGLTDPSPKVRATALGALARLGALRPADVETGLTDPEPEVRRRAAELAAGRPPGPTTTSPAALLTALADAEPEVVEAAAWALGELGDAEAVGSLAETARGHSDPLCREAAVAALGAIGDQRGLPAILAALADRPAVRRRAVLALAPFEGPQVDDALEAATRDRDWQVRQAAEDLRGGPGVSGST